MLTDRFWKQVDKTNNCWVWTGNLNDHGYGRFGINYKRFYVHRLSYEYYKGKISSELEVDHLCKNRRCLNPDHLELVTHRENLLRSPTIAAIETAKTHCASGHEYSKDNLYAFKVITEHTNNY